jgi:hypothetical protein
VTRRRSLNRQYPLAGVSFVRRPAFSLVTLLVIVFAASVPSKADDDGNFCTSRGYLAYELREGITAGVVGHELRVVRFDSQRGIRVASNASLKDFQVQKMTCREDRVEIAGFGTVLHGDPPLTRCVIKIVDFDEKVSVPSCTDDAILGQNWRKAVGPEPANLGQSGRAGSIPLESVDPDLKYYLLLNSSRKKLGTYDWELNYKTELIQADSQGNILRRFVVYKARVVASSGGD